MEEDKEESSKKKLRQDDPTATAASLFTDDLILEILSRLPARSVCRFKSVSVPWRDLIADPVHRKRLPQTLAGFLYTGNSAESHHFASVSGGTFQVDPSLPFLQPKYKYIAYVDACNGLLLCACSNKENPDTKEEFHYVVCNPATERWIELPPQPQAWTNRYPCVTCLAFDPKVSSHFHVLEFSETTMDVGSYVTGVDIFSSQTGAWIRRDSELVDEITTMFGESMGVLFGGMLHLSGKLNPRNTYNEPALLVVDLEGKAWKTIRLPGVDDSFYDSRLSYDRIGMSYDTIGLSQGCLYYASTTEALIGTEISLWCLENYDSEEWVLKHSATIAKPGGINGLPCRVFGIHPDCDTVFMYGGDNMLAAYDMQRQKFVHIINLEKQHYPAYLPYVPFVLGGTSRCRWAVVLPSNDPYASSED